MVFQQEIMLNELKSSFPLPLESFLRTAILMVEMVHQLHKKNEIIGVLHPENIKINYEQNIAKLIESMKWNEAYRAPEYNRAFSYKPSQQSDQYSLGVIFYEMLTGEVPIKRTGEDQDWAYLHQVILPPLITEYQPSLSDSLHTIVLKLLSKSPDDRYKNTYGLLADLRHCESSFKTLGRIEKFDIGHIDRISSYHYPTTLISRDKELTHLLDSYNRASQEQSIIVSILGDQGNGKTTLLDSFFSRIAGTEALLLRAECKESVDDSLTPILKAIQIGFERLWSEGTDKILAVRDRLEREFGEHISIMWSVMPTTATHLRLYPREQLTKVTNQQITELAVVLLGCLISYQRPVVLAIDGLQWADSSTLHTLKHLANSKTLSNIMIIGVEDNENQHFYSYLNELSRSSLSELNRISFIKINPFVYDEVRTLVSAVVHEDSQRLRVLARIAYDLTAGNVNKLKELLDKWYTQKKLIFDEHRCCWAWEEILNEQTNEHVSDSLHLYEAGYQRLTEKAQVLLIVASVIGVKFNLKLLSEVCHYSKEQTLPLLHLAEKEGIVCREDDGEPDSMENSYYLFMNKQLRLMLYQNMKDSASSWHYKIGAAYVNRYERELFSIDYSLQAARHWNLAIEHLSQEEKYKLAELNLKNAKWSNKCRKHEEAVAFTKAGIELLDINRIPIAAQSEYYFELALGEYMLGHMNEFRLHLQHLSTYIDQLNKTDKIRLLINQLEMLTFADNKEAIKIGLLALSEFDWFIPERVTTSMLIKEVVATQVTLRRFKKSKRQLPLNNDTDYELFSKLMISVCMPYLAEDPLKLIYTFAKYIRYGLIHGSNEYFLGGVAIYELILQRGLTFLYKILPSEALSTLEAQALANGFESTYRIPLVNGIYHQLNDPTITVSYINRAIGRSIENRDIIMANFSIVMLLNSYYGNIHELKLIHTYIDNEAREYFDEKTYELLSISKAYYIALQGERDLDKYGDLIENIDQKYWNNQICKDKLEVSYFAGKYSEALSWAAHAKRLEVSYDWLYVRKIRMFEALAAAALYESAEPDERKNLKKIVHKQINVMSSWKGFWGKESAANILMQAEWKRLLGKSQRIVIEMYELAIRKAKTENYALIEAIAGERLFDYFERNNKSATSTSAIILIDACTAYATWGIEAKVKQLRKKYPDLHWYIASAKEQATLEQAPHKEAIVAIENIEQPEDATENAEETILSMMRWSSSGNNKTNMIEHLLEVALSQLGGNRICIITNKNNDYTIEKSVGRQMTLASASLVPLRICRYVCHTGQTLVLDNAQKSDTVNDHYIKEMKPKSVICMQIGKKTDNIVWMIYVENTYMPNIFSERSVHLLEVMITRLAYLYWMKNEKPIEWLHDYDSPSRSKSKVEHIEPEFSYIESLTQREQEVLNALTAGLSNKEIAEQLYISEATVKTHLVNIYSKLGVKRRSQAINRAKELNII